MEEYGKVFRKYSLNNSLNVHLEKYNPNDEMYHHVIARMKKEGFKQIIINSDMMIRILEKTLFSNNFILKINFTESTDESVIEDVKSLVRNIRKNPVEFVKLKDLLKWVLDKNSIDISKIEVAVDMKKIDVYSNGLIIGDRIDIFFETIIKDILEDFL